MPYGDKSLDDLKLRVRQLYQGLQRTFGTQHLVLACNSASASLPLPATLPALGVGDDAMASLSVAGVLPPLVDIISTTVTHATAWAHAFVAMHGRPPRLALVATVATHRSHRYEDWMGYAEAPCQLASFACPGLASAIEHQAPNLATVLAYALAPVQRWQPDALILGCTHYLLVAPLFAQVLGDEVALINPAGVIAERLVAGLPTTTPNMPQGNSPPTVLLTTGDLATATDILNPWVELCQL
jgi:glutamate racemase